MAAPSNPLSPITKLVHMILEDRREFFSILVLSLIQSILLLVVPLVAQGLVNVVVSGLYLQPLAVLTGALLFGLLFAGILAIVRFYLVEIMRERIFARVALRVAQRLLKVSHRTLNENNGPELMNRFFDVVNVQKSWFKLAYEGPGAVLEILVGLVLLALYGTELFGLAAGFLGLSFLMILAAGYSGLTTSLVESSKKYKVAGWLEDTVRCQDATKLNSRPNYWPEETDRRVVSFLGARRAHFRILMRQKALYYVLSSFALAAMLGLGGYLVIQGELTLGQLVAAELVIWGVLKASQKLIALTEPVFDLLTGLEKIGVITAMEIDPSGTANLPWSDQGAKINLHNLSFAFSSSPPWILDDVDWEVEGGEMVTVLGDSGVGKSSLIYLLAGFLRPQRGSVEVEALDLREIHPDALGRNLAIITDNADLFEGSLFHNITLGRDFDVAKVRSTLELCGGKDLLRRLPDGVHSQIASSGRTLSGSERQMVLLARALVGDPRLFLIDESLHCLSESQMRVLVEHLRKRSCTIVSTLPQPAFVAASQRVFELKSGKLRLLGSPKAFANSSDFSSAGFTDLKANLQRLLSDSPGGSHEPI